MPAQPTLAIVVTTYKPDAEFATRFSAALGYCNCFIVVDNTPGGHCFTGLNAHAAEVVVLQDGVNKGLGKALNLGIAAALRAGSSHAVLFDQDSSPNKAFLTDMLAMHQLAEREQQQPVCIGPLHVDDATHLSKASQDRTHAHDVLRPVSCLATSGMLFRPDRLPTGSSFTEEFFLDFVDFDWCWRLQQKGWVFRRALGVTMLHRLGLAQRSFLGLTYHVPAPYRHYFQFRDTLRLVSKSHVPLYAKFRLGLLLPLKIVAYPFVLDKGWERLRWMVRGIADALRGVTGAGAAGKALGA